MKEAEKTRDSEPVKKYDFGRPALFLPDGRPAPAVMTSDEVALFLRLDGTGQRALKYWRDTGQITGIRIGRRVRYTLDEVLRFLVQKTAKSRGVGYVSQRS